MTSFEPGGTERQMIELVRRLDSSRWTVHLACFKASGAWFHRVEEVAASVTEFPVTSFKSPNLVQQIIAFSQWCRRLNIAVVYTAAMPSNIFGLPGAAMARIPVRIGNRREINPDKSGLDIAMQRAAYACAHRVVANSRAAADRLMMERVPARKIVIIPNGLDTGRFKARARRIRPRKVAVVANLRPEKGHDVLIDAAPGVLARFPDAHFEIIGAGPEWSALIERAEARGVLHAFTFFGHCDDVAGRLEEADLFVLPSRSEAFPNAVLEAMASGLAVVASGVGGIRELIDHEQTGLLVASNDSRALAERICQIMGDAPLATRLGAAAKVRAERYSFDRMVGAFEAVYLAELTRRGVLAAPRARLAQTTVS